MRMLYLGHIIAGSLALLSGYAALYARKGATLHRRAGIVFVYAMLTMALAGVLIAAVRRVAPAVNIPAGLLTGYLVITSLMTVRPVAKRRPWLDAGLMLLALGLGAANVTLAFNAMTQGGSATYAAIPFTVFGAVGLLAGAGDFRVLRSGPLQGARCLARHLWRMSFALVIAALSFFIGQADEFPPALRIMPLLALPVLAALVTMLYWLWRVRIRRSMRGITNVRVVGAM